MKKMGRPQTITGPIAELALKLGGVAALANQVKVSPRTVRYWAKKEKVPSGPAQTLLELLGEKHGVLVSFND